MSTFVAPGTVTSNTTTGAVTMSVSEPGGASDGDLLLLVLARRYTYDNSSSSNTRDVSTPSGWTQVAGRTQTTIGASSNTRVTLSVWSQTRSGTASASIPITAGSASSVAERAWMMGVTGADYVGTTTADQGTSGTSWPTAAQTLTADAFTVGFVSIITNNSTTAQSLSTANSFTLEYTATTSPARAVAFRSISDAAGTYNVPQWDGSGALRAQTTFRLQVFDETGTPTPDGGIYIDGAVHLS